MNFIELNREHHNHPTKEVLSDFVYEVRNCLEVRRQLINGDSIEKFQHVDWINNTYNENLGKTIYIAECNRVLVGYCDVDMHDIGYCASDVCAEVGFKLHSFEHGKGLGKIMIREFLNYLLKSNKNILKLWLSVLASNDKATHLYTNLGFSYVMTKLVNYKAVDYYELEIQRGKVY